MEEKNEFPLQGRDYGAEILALIRGGLDRDELKAQLSEYHENDIAGILEELTDEEREALLPLFDSETMSGIVPYLDDAGEYLAALDADEAADIIEQMDADDALEALDDLDEETRSEILEHIEDEEVREDIELLDSYQDNEFGSRMSTNYIVVQRNLSVKETNSVISRLLGIDLCKVCTCGHSRGENIFK